MTREEQIAQVERDRRRREDALLLLLLALALRARRNVNRAIRVGADWRPILAATLLGDDSLDLPGGVPLLALLMADSHAAGATRIGRMLGVELASVEPAETLRTAYEPRARESLDRIRSSLQASVEKSLADAAEKDRISADVQAVSEAFAAAGWTAEKKHGAEAEATAAVTSAYASGMAGGLDDDASRAVMTGLRFVNPLDERTTLICRARHLVTLPLDHPWWFRNWPPLHFGCRSIVLPLVGEGVKFTENPSEFPPPDPGWGQWAGILSAFAPRVAGA